MNRKIETFKRCLVMKKNTSKSYALQNRLCKSWIERHWNFWKRSLKLQLFAVGVMMLTRSSALWTKLNLLVRVNLLGKAYNVNPLLYWTLTVAWVTRYLVFYTVFVVCTDSIHSYSHDSLIPSQIVTVSLIDFATFVILKLPLRSLKGIF